MVTSTRTYTFEEPLYLAYRFARDRAEREPTGERRTIVEHLEAAIRENDFDRAAHGLPMLGKDYEP